MPRTPDVPAKRAALVAAAAVVAGCAGPPPAQRAALDRIDTIVVIVDKRPYETTSIIELVTLRFGLEPLPGVRANAGDLTNALELR